MNLKSSYEEMYVEDLTWENVENFVLKVVRVNKQILPISMLIKLLYGRKWYGLDIMEISKLKFGIIEQGVGIMNGERDIIGHTIGTILPL